MTMVEFTRYKGFWLAKNNITKGLYLKPEEAKQILAGGGYFIRNTYNWDKAIPTQYWYIIKDSFGGIEELPAKVRNQVKKALRTYDYKKVSQEEMLNCGLKVYNESFSRFGRAGTEIGMDFWQERICRDHQDYWLGYDKETGTPVIYAINRQYEEYIDFSGMGFSPKCPNSTYPMYGLIYEMNRYYLEEKKCNFVCDGAKSITEHSNFQPFLEDKFKFRKAYCDLQLFYKPWVGLIVKCLFPFRRWIKYEKVAAILRQEAWARGREK